MSLINCLFSCLFDISFIIEMFLTLNFVEYSILSLGYRSVGIGSMFAVASIGQLPHWFLIDFADAPALGYDSVVGMGWKWH